MATKLVLWRFESGGGELYALSTGGVPPAQEHLVKDWNVSKSGWNLQKKPLGKLPTNTPERF
jgi:hypothetical protein